MDTSKPPADRASALLAAMSIDDKVHMASGDPRSGGDDAEQTNMGDLGDIPAIPALCVPAVIPNDAGNGVGGNQQLTTAFPTGIAQAATWNPEVGTRLGSTIGTEAFAKGVNVLLGPAMNIARTPLNGRNFEYLGEDPYLAGEIAASLVKGVQSQHVVATVKHYALNDQERNRKTQSSDASERTIKEIHLPAFESAVAKGGAGAVMCSYNRVNGVYACENPTMLDTYLRKQMGFTGFVMSDWSATRSTVGSATAGLDMSMPDGNAYYGGRLKAAVQSGKVPMATLDAMTYRILFTMFRVGLFDHVPQEGAAAFATPASDEASLELARQVAQQGTVLLKNDGNVLPLTGGARRIAVIGEPANPIGAALDSQGWGSGHVPLTGVQPGVVSPLESITARAARAGDVVTYDAGRSPRAAAASAAAADTAVVFIHDVESEGYDRRSMNAETGACPHSPLGGTQCTYDAVDQNALVSAVARANPRTIVVIQSGGPVAMPWVNEVKGIVENWFPGQVDGDAIAPVLFGDVNAFGKLPVTFPKALADGPIRTASQYPGVYDANGIPRTSYSEGLLVGYRWFDARNIKPLFPFGYGLSYTSFRFSDLHVSPAAQGGATVSATVTDAGARAGDEVAQLYVTFPPAAGEPPRQLKAFQRVSLQPGQSKTVTLSLDARSFSNWDEGRHQWSVTPGCYGIAVGDSSASLPLHGQICTR